MSIIDVFVREDRPAWLVWADRLLTLTVVLFWIYLFPPALLLLLHPRCPARTSW